MINITHDSIAVSASLILAMGVGLYVGFAALEPATSNAQASASSTVQVNLTVDEEITITNQDGNSINMANLGVAVDESTGGTSFEVVTNSSAGYELEVAASTSPAMLAQGSQTTDFQDYGAGTPETWDISDVSGTAQDFAFGFSAYNGASNNDSGTQDWGTGTACDGSGSDSGTAIPSDKNYIGFSGTTTIKVGETTSAVSGESTTVCFAAAKQGDAGDGQPEAGSYQATVIATATTL